MATEVQLVDAGGKLVQHRLDLIVEAGQLPARQQRLRRVTGVGRGVEPPAARQLLGQRAPHEGAGAGRMQKDGVPGVARVNGCSCLHHASKDSWATCSMQVRN